MQSIFVMTKHFIKHCYRNLEDRHNEFITKAKVWKTEYVVGCLREHVEL